MKTVSIKGIGNEVSAISLGVADIGTAIPVEDGFRMIDAYLDRGGNLLDTARIYSDWVPGEIGRSERILGDYLRRRGSHNSFFIATKGAHPRLDSMHTPRMSRAEVEDDLNLSLKALGVEAIDLYYLHRDDRNRSVEEILLMLEDFVKAGKIRQYACSNWRADRMLESYACAELKGYHGFVANQIFWNLGSVNSTGLQDDTCEAYNSDMKTAFAQTGMVAAAFTSQANGFFTKADRGGWEAVASNAMYHTAGNSRVFEQARRIAQSSGRPMTEIVLSYLLYRPHPTVAVVGCKNMGQLLESLQAAEQILPIEQLHELENTIYQEGN